MVVAVSMFCVHPKGKIVLATQGKLTQGEGSGK